MSQIIPLIVNRLVSHLDNTLRVQISSSDRSRAALVKPWRLQASPLQTPIYCAVQSGNLLDPKQKDARIGADEIEDLSLVLPIGEIGGGHYWWRRGMCSIGCFYLVNRYTEDQAAEYAHIFLGRVVNQVERCQVADLVDEFGERAYQINAFASTFVEGGGPEDQYLWRGEVWWQVLTRRVI